MTDHNTPAEVGALLSQHMPEDQANDIAEHVFQPLLTEIEELKDRLEKVVSMILIDIVAQADFVSTLEDFGVGDAGNI